jgi:hypothetical protein
MVRRMTRLDLGEELKGPQYIIETFWTAPTPGKKKAIL